MQVVVPALDEAIAKATRAGGRTLADTWDAVLSNI